MRPIFCVLPEIYQWLHPNFSVYLSLRGQGKSCSLQQKGSKPLLSQFFKTFSCCQKCVWDMSERDSVGKWTSTIICTFSMRNKVIEATDMLKWMVFQGIWSPGKRTSGNPDIWELFFEIILKSGHLGTLHGHLGTFLLQNYYLI